MGHSICQTLAYGWALTTDEDGLTVPPPPWYDLGEEAWWLSNQGFTLPDVETDAGGYIHPELARSRSQARRDFLEAHPMPFEVQMAGMAEWGLDDVAVTVPGMSIPLRSPHRVDLDAMSTLQVENGEQIAATSKFISDHGIKTVSPEPAWIIAGYVG